MFASKLLFLLLVVAVIVQTDCWRRRRRRRSCNRRNCVTSWGAWSACTCANRRTRTLRIVAHPVCGGAACPALTTQTGSCISPHRRNCVTSWGAWSACTCANRRTRTLRIVSHPACGGAACPRLHSQSGTCVSPHRRNCISSWGAWSACSCSNRRVRTLRIVTNPACGGTACPTQRTQTGTCFGTRKRNCVTSWGSWSACTCSNRRTRTLRIVSHPACGGAACPPLHSQSGACVSSRRRNCVSSWGAWTACNCLNQRKRTLRIVSQPVCGGTACPPLHNQIGTCSGSCTTKAGYCDVRSGRCRCNPGRTGTRCQSVCPKGRYGHNCASRCNCVAGISCDAAKGYCKCPIGRSGRRCQFTYKCPRRNRCYTLKPTFKPTLNYCYLQQRVGRRPVSSSCPRRTHYVDRCVCYKNCTRATMINFRKCVCRCKAANSLSVPRIYRGKYVTRAICCPRHPFF